MFNLPDRARVWIYQSSRAFNDAETADIEAFMRHFLENWASHGRELATEGALVHQRFLVFVVDETATGASGCSIDKSVGFVRDLQTQYNVDFLDRMTFAFRNSTREIVFAHSDEFARLYREELIDNDTIVFNNLVQTLGEFRAKWEVRLAESWHKRFV